MVSVANAPDLPAPLFLNGPPPGGFGLIIGSDGIGKGWLTLDLLLGCMLARPMNVPRFRRDAATLRVMYLSYEDDTCVLRGRLDAVCAAAGVEAALWRDAEADGRFRTLTDLGPLFTQYGCNPPVATDTFRGLEAALRREQTELCVIDPLAAAMAVQNENDNCTLNGVAIALRRLAAETGCAILVTHHTSKAQREAEEHHAARGGSALTGAARWVLRVIQNGADSARLTVNIPKNNYGPALPAVHLERTRSGPLREINEEQVRTFRENLLQNVVRIVRENPDTEINPNGIRNNCSPGARLLCAKTRAGSRHVADAVQQAIAAGLLTVEQRRRKGNGRIYSVLVPLSSPAP